LERRVLLRGGMRSSGRIAARGALPDVGRGGAHGAGRTVGPWDRGTVGLWGCGCCPMALD